MNSKILFCNPLNHVLQLPPVTMCNRLPNFCSEHFRRQWVDSYYKRGIKLRIYV